MGSGYPATVGSLPAFSRPVALVAQLLCSTRRSLKLGLGSEGSEALGAVTGRPAVFTREKVREMTQPAWVCSADDLRHDLGWRPEVQIHEGARLTYEWYKQAGWM